MTTLPTPLDRPTALEIIRRQIPRGCCLRSLLAPGAVFGNDTARLYYRTEIANRLATAQGHDRMELTALAAWVEQQPAQEVPRFQYRKRVRGMVI